MKSTYMDILFMILSSMKIWNKRSQASTVFRSKTAGFERTICAFAQNMVKGLTHAFIEISNEYLGKRKFAQFKLFPYKFYEMDVMFQR